MTRRLAVLLTAAIIAIISTFWVMAKQSQSGYAIGLINNKLAACPSSPNCVCSEFPEDKAHYLSPVSYNIGPSVALVKASEIIAQQGGEINVSEENYLAATFRSETFGFIDDFEIRLASEPNQIHIRAAARVGYSDFGVNTERAQQLAKLFNTHLNL